MIFVPRRFQLALLGQRLAQQESGGTVLRINCERLVQVDHRPIEVVPLDRKQPLTGITIPPAGLELLRDLQCLGGLEQIVRLDQGAG